MNRGELKGQGETIDDLLSGGLKIFQKEKGYRFALDSILLAHFINLKRTDRVIDIGTGSGVIPLILAYRYPALKIVGLEIQEELAHMAKRSVTFNGLEDRIDIIHGDVKNIRDLCPPQSFDGAVFNPPYRKLNSGKINPAREKAIARHEILGSLGDFMAAARYLLKDAGAVYAIYPARRGVELILRMRTNDIEPKRLRMVYSDAASDAEFALVEGAKRGGEELTVMPPLFIYDGEGSYTGDMEAIFRKIATPAGIADS